MVNQIVAVMGENCPEMNKAVPIFEKFQIQREFRGNRARNPQGQRSLMAWRKGLDFAFSRPRITVFLNGFPAFPYHCGSKYGERHSIFVWERDISSFDFVVQFILP